MSVNARGITVLALSLGGLAVTSAIVFWPSHPSPRPAELVATDASTEREAAPPTPKEHAALCDDIAKRYRSAWSNDSTGCVDDTDCAGAPRGGFYMPLDGCARFGNTTLPRDEADAVAAKWLEEDCAWSRVTFVRCGPIGRAQCSEKRCVEVPPDPVPKTWRRISLPGVVSVFAPPDFVARPERGVFWGDHRVLRFHFEVGPVDGSATLPFTSVIDGHRARIEQERGQYGPSVDFGLARGVVFEEPWEVPPEGPAEVRVMLTCDDVTACSVWPTILKSLHFLSESVGARP